MISHTTFLYLSVADVVSLGGTGALRGSADAGRHG